MPLARREFIHLAASGVASSWITRQPSQQRPPRSRVIAFDGFVVFDPRPALALAQTMFAGKAAELVALWRTRQFEYQWLRTLAGQFADFERTAQDGLEFALDALRLDANSDRRTQLLHSYLELTPWPDASDALAAMKARGFRLALLSNMTRAMLDDGVRRAGWSGTFEQVLSTDAVRAHKPDPRAYRSLTDAFALPRAEVLYVAFASWDVAGATWYGLPTFWANRLDLAAERLGAPAIGTGRELREVLEFAERQR